MRATAEVCPAAKVTGALTVANAGFELVAVAVSSADDGRLRKRETLVAVPPTIVWVVTSRRESVGCADPGVRVAATVEFLLGSAVLTAVMVTVVLAASVAGAVYRPFASMVPTAGFTCHVTRVSQRAR